MAVPSRFASSAFFAVTLLIAPSLSVWAQSIRVGSPAPEFTATDSNSQTHSLSQYRGKYVVLEWHNQGCPYTRKHYVSGNMQNLQKEWTAKGVVWFTVVSSAPGRRVMSRRRRRMPTLRRCTPRRPPFSWIPTERWAASTTPRPRLRCL